MADRSDPTQAARRTLDHELSLVEDAVRLVASGGSPRVVVSGLYFAEILLPRAEALAAAWDVTIRPLWTTDESGADLVVEAKP